MMIVSANGQHSSVNSANNGIFSLHFSPPPKKAFGKTRVFIGLQRRRHSWKERTASTDSIDARRTHYGASSPSLASGAAARCKSSVTPNRRQMNSRTADLSEFWRRVSVVNGFSRQE